MHQGIKPAAQPRSLRSIVQEKNAAGGFPPPAPVPELEGAPYRDVAEQVRPTTMTATLAPVVNPLRNVRGGNR